VKLSAGWDCALQLEVIGYQFPKLETEPYDSNWLNIRIEATHPGGKWKATDPSLLTYEAAELADWLDGVANGSIVAPSELSFLEPNLRFELIEKPSPTVRVYFELESRPKWAPADGASMDDLWLDFPVDSDQLRAAASNLRAQLRPFPQRASS
jgi:hypothetical protein